MSEPIAVATDPTTQWVLNHGCWRGTITSRDTAYPERFDTRDAAIAKLAEHNLFYRSIGYSLWFAELVAPDGTVTVLA
jgi:hypothetical protein